MERRNSLRWSLKRNVAMVMRTNQQRIRIWAANISNLRRAPAPPCTKSLSTTFLSRLPTEETRRRIWCFFRPWRPPASMPAPSSKGSYQRRPADNFRQEVSGKGPVILSHNPWLNAGTSWQCQVPYPGSARSRLSTPARFMKFGARQPAAHRSPVSQKVLCFVRRRGEKPNEPDPWVPSSTGRSREAHNSDFVIKLATCQRPGWPCTRPMAKIIQVTGKAAFPPVLTGT